MAALTKLASLIIIAAASRLATAQVGQLTTDYTGSVLYFAAEMYIPDSGQQAHWKIFRWTRAAGVEPFVERPRIAMNQRDTVLTNYFRPSYPSVSADGQILAFAATGDVLSDRAPPATRARKELLDTATGEISTLDLDGLPELSPNGRWMILRGDLEVFQPPALSRPLLVWSRDTGKTFGVPRVFRQTVGASFAGTRQMIADTGEAVFIATPLAGLGIAGPNGRIEQLATAPATAPVISGNGRVIAYETLPAEGRPPSVRILDRNSGEDRLLLVAGPAQGRLPAPLGFDSVYTGEFYSGEALPILGLCIDREGSTVLIKTAENPGEPQRWLLALKTDGTGGRWAGRVEEGYRELALSGDGKVAFGVTNLGRLVRVDLASDALEELLPRTPRIERVRGAAYRGAWNRIQGGGFTSEVCAPQSFPAPDTLCGVTVQLDGKRMPLLRVSPEEIEFQIPWEFPVLATTGQDMQLRVTVDSSSGLQAPPVMRRYAPTPRFEHPGPVREDGSPLDGLSPAVAGEILSVRVTGFELPGVTGVPDAAGAEAKEALECNVEVLHFGWIKAMAGVAELRFRAPAPPQPFPFSLIDCRMVDPPLRASFQLPMIRLN